MAASVLNVGAGGDAGGEGTKHSVSHVVNGTNPICLYVINAEQF